MKRALAAALVLAALAACGRHEGAQAPDDRYAGTPTASAHPAGGPYGKVQYVTIAADEPGTIHYTTDGTAPVPGTGSTRSGRNPVFWVRAGPGTTTVTFFAVDDAGNRGPTATATYEVTLP